MSGCVCEWVGGWVSEAHQRHSRRSNTYLHRSEVSALLRTTAPTPTIQPLEAIRPEAAPTHTLGTNAARLFATLLVLKCLEEDAENLSSFNTL